MADVIPISAQRRAARESALERYCAAYNAGDVAGVVASFATPRLEIIPAGRVVDGVDDVTAYLTERHKGFPDHSIEPIALHHADDVVVAEMHMAGTHLGMVNEIEPTGHRYRVRVVGLFEFRGDDLVGIRLYYDSATIVRQLA